VVQIHAATRQSYPTCTPILISAVIKTAFLPSAGLGKRLRPLTNRIPKPLLPVRGEPLIGHAMRHCTSIGIERFVVNTHHLPKSFDVAFPSGQWDGIPIDFVHEPVRLETGTGLRNLVEKLDLEEPLLVYNSDILTDLPLGPLLEAHEKKNRPLATLAISSCGPQLHISADSDGCLTAVRRSDPNQPGRSFQYLGVSIVEPGLIPFITETEPESLVHAWTRAIARHPGSIRVHAVSSGRWIDAGSLALYESLRENGLNADGVLRLGRPTAK